MACRVRTVGIPDMSGSGAMSNARSGRTLKERTDNAQPEGVWDAYLRTGTDGLCSAQIWVQDEPSINGEVGR
jgi:hypothetical protein